MKTKLRIAYISQEYPPETGWGGIGSYTYEMANGLSALGMDVMVICKAVEKPTVQIYNSLQIHRILPGPEWGKLRGGWRVNRFWPGFSWAAAQRLKELFDLQPIDLVEYPEARADGFFVPFMLKRIKRIVRLHTAWIFVDRINSIKPTMQKRWMYWLEKQSILNANCITSPSNAMVDLTESWIPVLRKRQHAVLPNPVDDHAFLPISDKANPPEIVFIGRPERHKGLETIAQALPEILQGHPQAIFRFLGDPQSETDGQPAQTWVLQRLPESLHHRIFFGAVPRSELPTVLSRASLCIMPSLWENFPYAVLEAMACGLPVVATRTGGLPELIEENVTGLLIPPQDPQALAQAVQKILSNRSQATAMGLAARTRIETRFSRSVVLPEMLKFYLQLAGA